MKFAERLAGPHDLISLSGTQFAFYDDPDTVMRASASAVEHLQRTLAYRASASDADAAALMMTQSVRARTHVLGTMSPQQQP